jgi:hypothetical protein
VYKRIFPETSTAKRDRIDHPRMPAVEVLPVKLPPPQERWKFLLGNVTVCLQLLADGSA